MSIARHRRSEFTLPNETLTAIFEDLPAVTLVQIACVSPHFNAVAERILYSSISITDNLSLNSPMPTRTLRFCQSILSRGHLLEIVKKFHIRWQATDQSSLSPQLLPAYTNIRHALRSLTYLESLEIFLGPANFPTTHSETIHAIERIIYGCQFPYLRSCSLGADWTKGAQPYTGVLATFLCCLPSLRHLKLTDHHAPLNIPPFALLHLSSFRGSADTAAALLPGRPVQYLALLGQDSDVNRENLPLMSHTSIPLRYLDLSAMSVRPILLRNISTYLPTIEILKVRLALRHTLHYALSGIRLLAGLSSVLSAFNNLRCLDLSPTDIDGVGHANADEESATCRVWSTACPSLRRIIFPSQTEWTATVEGWALVLN